MTGKTLVRATAAVAALAIACAVTLGHYKSVKTLTCRSCLSKHITVQWFAGFPHKSWFALSHPTDSVRTSLVFDRAFDSTHDHEWAYDSTSYYIIFGRRWAGVACAQPIVGSRFSIQFEANEDFRNWLRDKVENKELSPAELRQLLQLHDVGRPGQSLDPTSTLGVLANRVLTEYDAHSAKGG